MRRLARAGFKGDFVRRALLPDWWDVGCERDPALLPDLEIRVARFLGATMSVVRDPAVGLAVPSYPGAQLRRVRDVTRDRLAPAIHTAMQVASAVVRTLGADAPPVHVPPVDGLSWRAQIERPGPAVRLDDILGDLWRRGIPVVAVDALPAPSFQGLACIVEGRPVLMVGYKHDEPGRIAALTAHEAGHVAAGDCTTDHPVVDEEDEVVDEGDMERAADRYATRVLIGGEDIPVIRANNYRDLARAASKIEKDSGADAGAIIFSNARQTGDYAMATMAAKALYRASGARRLLGEYLASHVDIESASESDRVLLRCALGGAERDASGC